MAMAARDGAITTARPQVICCYDNVNMIATVFFVAKIYNTYLPRRDQGGKGSHLNSLMEAKLPDVFLQNNHPIFIANGNQSEMFNTF